MNHAPLATPLAALDALAQPLQQAAADLRLPVSSEQTHRLLEYLRLMLRWNRAYNLTAIREPQAMLTQHVVDSLAILPELDRFYRGQRVQWLDLGAGAGLPSVVMAIMRPHWHIHAVDAVEKKVSFLRQVVASLGLKNLQPHHGRIEAMSTLKVDAAICRAFAALDQFIALAAPHVQSGASFWAMKGQLPSDEVTALERPGHYRVYAQHALHVPGLNAQRCLLHIVATDCALQETSA